MTLQPHQKRVVDERNDLAGRLEKLCAFIASNPLFHKQNALERNAMERQCEAMHEYLRALDDRLAYWGVPTS